MIRILKILITLAILGPTAGLRAQNIEFTAATKNNVQAGEQFRAVYTVNKQVDAFEGPDFEGFNVLSGPNQSTNQSYQFVNGKVSQSYQISYTYYLQAVKDGSFNIGPAKVSLGGKTYQSNSLTISVSQSTSSQAPQPRGNQRPAQTSQSQGTPDKNDLFIKAYRSSEIPALFFFLPDLCLQGQCTPEGWR